MYLTKGRNHMPYIGPRKIISSLLACTCLLWTSGCYTVTQITPTDEYQGKAINVTTKDGLEIRMSEWKLLPNGDIEGKGRRMMGVHKSAVAYEGVIAADNILNVTYDEFNTTLCIMLGTVGAVSLIWWLIKESQKDWWPAEGK
jgi:hypothetical protein